MNTVQIKSLAKKADAPIDFSYIFLYPEGQGYSYAIMWYNDKSIEVVGGAHKAHKTKQECIKTIKKMTAAFPGSFVSKPSCYDYLGRKVDIEIKYNVTRLI